MSNYVNFLRGSQKAYKRLPRKDPDTFYFVKDDSSDISYLYIGEELIGSSSTAGEQSLAGLQDVVLERSATGDVLVYNSLLKIWENKNIKDIITIMTGASSLKDGTSGLVPAPKLGEQDYFLRGDGTWQPISQSVKKFSDEFILTEDNVLEINKISPTKIEGFEVIQKKVDSLNADVTELKENFNVQQSTITNLSQELIDVNKTVQVQQSKILQLQNSISEIDKTLEINQQEIFKLTNKINEVESVNKTLTVNFNALIAEVERQNLIDQELTIMIQNLDDRLTWGSIKEEEINNG